MKISSLVENTSKIGLPVEHGLSLYIELDNGKRILFDMGQSSLFVDNAKKLGLHIEDVDIAVISHGHYDHGGGLSKFLKTNKDAKIFIHKEAFQKHYSLKDNGLKFIGLDKELENNERIVFCNDFQKIDNNITLFANVQGDCCNPMGNRLLFDTDKKTNDNFRHEQNLVIEENGKNILFAGCAHRGIINIIKECERRLNISPDFVFGGMHLVKSGLSEEDNTYFIEKLANGLKQFPKCKFYTMHCTGTEEYNILKNMLGSQIDYMSCGEERNI